MITTLFKAFEDITNLIKEGKHNVIKTVINNDYNENTETHTFTINLILKKISKENK